MKIVRSAWVDFGEIRLKIERLTPNQYMEITSLQTFEGGKIKVDTHKKLWLAIKYCVKEVEGIDNYSLIFEDQDGSQVLTDDCVMDLVSLQVENLAWLASKVAEGGIPNELVNPLTGEKIKGVKILIGENKQKKSKKK